jgi:primosomal protein N' (replication factor Y)
VATPRLFRLKSQVAPAPHSALATDLPFARVLVDTGVFHLDSPYDYEVPQKLSELVTTGVRVQVPFGNREVEGLVIERIAAPSVTNALKTITKVLSPHQVATPRSLELIAQVALRWATNPWDVVRSAIPPRVASVDKAHVAGPPTNSKSNNQVDITYRAFEPHLSPHSQVASLAQEASKRGSVLIVAPDERDIVAICGQLHALSVEVLRIDSGISRADRYQNFLNAMNAGNQIIIGSRNAIFVPLPEGATIIMFKESSPDLYEMRSPAWNARDVAMLRKSIDTCRVILCGYVPSLDVAALIDSKRVRYLNTNTKISVQAFTPVDSSLLPGLIFRDIRTNISNGPVLFLLPRKGYANGILCAHCKNVAVCACGGRLYLSNKNADPACRICGTSTKDWKCSFCQREKKYVVSRGIERAQEEISRAFPNIPIILSFGDVIKDHIEQKPCIVLATPGATPQVEGGYSAVVILEGLSYFSHDDLRANERATELFFEVAALVKRGGVVLLAIEDSHPIVSSLIRWNPSTIVRRELAQRAEISFPPSVNSAVMIIPTSQASPLVAGINRAITDARLASDTRVLGPTKIDSESSKVVILSSSDSRSSLTTFLHELMRRRSIAKKSDSSLRIDPYSL